MNKQEAERLYDSGKEPTVATLLTYADENNQLKEENNQLKRKIGQLEKNSETSSKPPSSDSPHEKKPTPPAPTPNNRKPGGQPGHKGNNRKLLPLEEVNEIIPYYPDQCERCGKRVPQDGTATTVGEPLRWQHIEIEPIHPIITEHQCHTVLCECGCCTTASLPPEVAKSNFGARLTAFIGYLAAVLHVSRRRTQEFCQTILNVEICLGSIQNLLETTSDALEQPDTELRNALPQEPVINADETSWRDRWLWIFVGSIFIYFQVALNRKSQVLVNILGEVYQGILCVDRWGAYTKYHKGRMQICWAHLKRDFLGIAKIGEAVHAPDALGFAQTMENLRKRLMALWYDYKEGRLVRAELIEKAKPVMEEMKGCLNAYVDSSERSVRGLARKLLKRFDHLFTFIFYEGVEPTNNLAERGIRSAVLWRTICFGNRSDTGAVLTSRLLTATRTCWLQKRNPLEFLVEAITAYRKGNPSPSLLTQSVLLK